MKKIILIVCSLLLFLSIAFLVEKQEKNNPKDLPILEEKKFTFEEAIKQITPEVLKKNLEYLASDQLEGRMSGKKGNILAAEFIKNEFEKIGLKTAYHKFNIKRLNPGPRGEKGDDFTQNVYGWIEGSDENLSKQIVVIGAHMDHIGYGPSMSRGRETKIHPGADDNASGTVALIEVAKCFSKLKNNKRTVVFMAFSAEEMGLIGSKFYCENPIFPIDSPDIRSHVFMLNMDMVGYLGQGAHTAAFSNGNSSVQIDRVIEELSDKYEFAKRITGRRSGGSDHACFYNKKIPIAFLHTGLHPHYHKPSDTADKINYEGLCKVSRYAFELGWRVTNEENSPVFNVAEFKEMDLSHDHGYQPFDK